MNKLFNGTGKVFIKSKSNRNILGKQYTEGSIIAYLEDVDISLGYNDMNSAATQGGNILAVNVDAFPSLLHIKEISNKSVLDKLLYSPFNSKTSYTITETYYVSDLENGKAFLNKEVDNVLSYSKVKSYKETGEEVEVSFNEEERSFTFADYDNAEYIRVFLTIEIDSTALSMTKQTQEYVDLEIHLEGKLGNESGYFVLTIPAAQVVSSPEYEFLEGRLEYANELTFAIIDTKRTSFSFVVD